MRARCGGLLLVLSVAALVGEACSRPGQTAESAAASSGTGGVPLVDAGTPDAAEEDAFTLPDTGDAGASPVLVGVSPNPRDDDPSAPDPSFDTAARLTTVAAGAREAVIRRTLAELDPAAYAELATLGAFYAAHGAKVVFELDLVDRAADRRPAGLASLSWVAHPTYAAVDAALDGALGSLGTSVAYVVLGNSVDVFLGKHPNDRKDFETLAAHACARARQRAAGVLLAVGFSFEGVTQGDPSFAPLLTAGDAAAIAYLPGLGTAMPSPASSVSADVDRMIAATGGKPIVLTLGYPSSGGAGSSPARQQLFFETFFTTLAPRTDAFQVVDVFELHDPAPAGCAAYASSQGLGTESPEARFMCSVGLFTSDDTTKPAWTAVLNGLALFSSP